MYHKASLPLLLTILFMISTIGFGQNKAPKTKKSSSKTATDIAKISPKPYPYKSNQKYKGMVSESMYLTMRDGVKIAIDLYLPKGLAAGDKIPAVIRQTRYWRAPKIKFPFNIFSDGLMGKLGESIKSIVNSGYAVINVDVRGSGASFGNRPHPWTADEIKDGAEIMDWAIKQEWCSGNIGSLGVSYGGTTAEFLATNKHPNLKAVILMFSLFDVYEDNAFPGGVHHSWFTNIWGEANERMDANQLPVNYEKYKFLIGGVKPIKTKDSKKLLKEALAEHSTNRNVHDGAVKMDFRDDIAIEEEQLLVDHFSPHLFIDALNDSGTAVYSYSGWMDGSYQNSAIKRHLNLNNPDNKLLIGPWEHGGTYNCSPFAPSLAGFDHVGEILKFLDFHLKGIKNGIDQEAPVHYFTMGSEKWQGSDTWPPKTSQDLDLYFNINHSLTSSPPDFERKTERYRVDNSTGTGEMTRWKALNGKINTAYMYHDWPLRTGTYLSFDSPVLTKDLEITGHAIFDVQVSFNVDDASLFVYLEDVDENGNAAYITEGLLRASHRKINEKGLYRAVGPAINHHRADALDLFAGQVAQMKTAMIPTSYVLKKGHQIRISIGGCDKDHFEIIHPKGYEMDFHYGSEHISKITLPVSGNPIDVF